MMKQTPRSIEILDESLLFCVIYWFTNILTIYNIIYGTVLFSSMLFISVTDGLIVIFQLIGGVMMCRIVLAYELVNFRRVIKGIERKPTVMDTKPTAEQGGPEKAEMERSTS
jgi:hypothetical protein